MTVSVSKDLIFTFHLDFNCSNQCCCYCSRYPFYASQVVGFRIEPLIWLRYTMWIPLYPLGIFYEGTVVMLVMWRRWETLRNQFVSEERPGKLIQTKAPLVFGTENRKASHAIDQETFLSLEICLVYLPLLASSIVTLLLCNL